MARERGTRNRRLSVAEKDRLRERLRLHADSGDVHAAGLLLIADAVLKQQKEARHG